MTVICDRFDNYFFIVAFTLYLKAPITLIGDKLNMVDALYFMCYVRWSAAYLPGQGAKQDLAVSVSSPSHSFPPFIGGGWLHNLVRLRMLPSDIPHVLGQVDQGVHEPQLPSRGPAKSQANESEKKEAHL